MGRPAKILFESSGTLRIFAIACGWGDADDLDSLRSDPAFKLACGRLPDTGRDLAPQPISRWDLASDINIRKNNSLTSSRAVLKSILANDGTVRHVPVNNVHPLATPEHPEDDSVVQLLRLYLHLDQVNE